MHILNSKMRRLVVEEFSHGKKLRVKIREAAEVLHR